MGRNLPALLLVFSLLATLATGCRSIEVKETRKRPPGIQAGEAVTVVLNFSTELTHEQARAAEEKAYHCLERALANTKPPIPLIPSDQFRAQAFPGLDFESAPRSPYSLGILANSPLFKERAAAMGLRYIVVVAGKTESKHQWGDFGCDRACFGIDVHEKTTRLGAVILDLKHSSRPGEINATVTGHRWIAVIGYFPIGLPTFTKGRACNELADRVATFVKGEKP